MSLLQVEIEEQQLHLLPSRGVYVPEHKTLLVADTHFGKEATFRRNQIPVPSGATCATLAMITEMLRETNAQRLIFLGDFFHASSSKSIDVMQSLDGFFAKHLTVQMQLTLGNHDRQLGELPASWSLEIEQQLQLGDLQLVHHPQEPGAGSRLVCCGHVHPAIRPRRATDRIGKLPCFWLSERQLVLPAIGDFTGTQIIRLGAKDRVWVCADDQVLAISGSRKQADK